MAPNQGWRRLQNGGTRRATVKHHPISHFDTQSGERGACKLGNQQETLNEFIFAEFDDRELGELTDRLAALRNRLEKACLKVVLDI